MKGSRRRRQAAIQTALALVLLLPVSVSNALEDKAPSNANLLRLLQQETKDRVIMVDEDAARFLPHMPPILQPVVDQPPAQTRCACRGRASDDLAMVEVTNPHT